MLFGTFCIRKPERNPQKLLRSGRSAPSVRYTFPFKSFTVEALNPQNFTLEPAFVDCTKSAAKLFLGAPYILRIVANNNRLVRWKTLVNDEQVAFVEIVSKRSALKDQRCQVVQNQIVFLSRPDSAVSRRN